MQRIAQAGSPEEAARIGRGAERGQPQLLRPNWATAKLAVMHAGLHAKVGSSTPKSGFPECSPFTIPK